MNATPASAPAAPRPWIARLRRLWRHRWQGEDSARRVLAPEALARLQARVAASEAGHSGEIRLSIEAGLPWSYLQRDLPPRARALTLFGKLRVWDTEQNNGVLIYLLLAERAIEIVADRGLAARVPPARWAELVSAMGSAFREGRFEDGLGQAVDAVDALLRQHFPLAEGRANPNELSDAVDVR